MSVSAVAAPTPDAGMLQTISAEVADDLGSVTVTVPAGISRLRSGEPGGVSNIEIISNGAWLGRLLVARDASAPLVYRATLEHSRAEGAIAYWHTPLRVSDWHEWLLMPDTWSMQRPFDLAVTVPDGGAAVMPFQLIEQKPGAFRYRAYPLLENHGGLSVFGSATLRQVDVGTGVLTAVVIGQDNEESDKLFNWIDSVAGSAQQVHQASPGEQSMIVVIPVPFVSGVVPWAHVRRGGGSHVIAYVKERATEEALMQDWTLFHEMTHLYHPYLNNGGRWVSEGFASYFQNVYRAQAGIVDPDYAYERFLAGLDRGKKENEAVGFGPVTDGGRMRTYWTGAALAFEADARLRSASNNTLSLASLIGQFANAQMPVSRSWHPRDYLSALDREAGMDVLVPLYDSYVIDPYFPEPGIGAAMAQQIFSSR